MKHDIDRAAFGHRVRQRREELGLSQSALGRESGFSQQNIGWIEGGNPKKDPRGYALQLAEPLRTTTNWLLHAKGPKDVGPRILSLEEAGTIYSELPIDERKRFSEMLTKAHAARQKRRKTA